MHITVLKSKIHNAVVTQAVLDYVGSITIDIELMENCGLIANERVLVVNNKNGERIETYVIKGKRGTGIICLNGAAAHKFNPGDTCIIMAFTTVSKQNAENITPECIYPYENNTKFKTNDEICQELLEEIIDDRGAINQDEVEEVSLRMGRTIEEITHIARNLLNHRQE